MKPLLAFALLLFTGGTGTALAAPAQDATDARAERDAFTRMYAEHGLLPIPIHLGGGKHHPENTLPAFRYSWALNLVPECDIRTTRDGVIVTIHDRTLARTAPGAPDALRHRPIEELTLAELQRADVGAYRGYPGQRVPTLDEVLAVMAKDHGKMLHVDYKDVDIGALAALVKRHGVEKQVIFTTNRHDLIQQWRALLPGAQAMIWMGGSQDEINATLDALRSTNFDGIYIVHMHYRPLAGGEAYNMSDAFMLGVQKELSAQGIVVQIQPLDIENPKIYEHLFGIGIRNIGTDYPDMLLSLRPKYFP